MLNVYPKHLTIPAHNKLVFLSHAEILIHSTALTQTEKETTDPISQSLGRIKAALSQIWYRSRQMPDYSTSFFH